MNNLKHKTIRQGVIYSLTSSLCLAAMAVVVTRLSGSLPTAQILFIRSALSLLLLSYFVYLELFKLSKVQMKHLFFRVCFGGVAVLIYFYNLSVIGPALSTALASFATVFSVLIGLLINHEKVTKLQMLGLLLCNVSLLTLFGQTQTIPVAQTVIGLMGALFTSIALQFVRKSAESDLSPTSIYVGFSFATLFFSLFFFDSVTWQLPSIIDINLSILMVLLAWAGQVGVAKAYVVLGNAKASSLGRIIVIWSVLFEALILKQTPSLVMVGLYSLIVVGAMLIGYGKKSKT
jgi:drug/metabolite transporter (DMT)-like permease